MFKAFKDAYAADSGGGGLVALLKPGGFVHADEMARQRTEPRIEFSLSAQAAGDASGARIDNAIARLHVFVRRDLAHGSPTPESGGGLEGIIDRVETIYNGASLTASGWYVSTLGRIRTIPGPSTPDIVHRVVEFRVVAEKT